MEGSLVAYKVFTNGSTLQASELNENLMQQSVATFSNAAARTAAITSPVEGQVTYLLDVDYFDRWTGSAWVRMFDYALVGSASFSGQSSVALDNIFSSQFRSYEFVFTNTNTTNASLFLQLRSGSTTISSTTYRRQQLYVGSTTVNAARSINQSNWFVAAINDEQNMVRGEIVNPFVAERTMGIVTCWETKFDQMITNAIQNSNATSYDGLIFTNDGGTMTGNVRVYGRRN
jgi:hypothetical protein